MARTAICIDNLRDFVPALEAGERAHGPYRVDAQGRAWLVMRSAGAAFGIGVSPGQRPRPPRVEPLDSGVLRRLFALRLPVPDVSDKDAVELGGLVEDAQAAHDGVLELEGVKFEAARFLPLRLVGEELVTVVLRRIRTEVVAIVHSPGAYGAPPWRFVVWARG